MPCPQLSERARNAEDGLPNAVAVPVRPVQPVQSRGLAVAYARLPAHPVVGRSLLRQRRRSRGAPPPWRPPSRSQTWQHLLWSAPWLMFLSRAVCLFRAFRPSGLSANALACPCKVTCWHACTGGVRMCRGGAIGMGMPSEWGRLTGSWISRSACLALDGVWVSLAHFATPGSRALHGCEAAIRRPCPFVKVGQC